ncbi:MAG: hypothetical protein LBG44_05770 [Gemmatimonadota bacterium]|jgi:hypothetical protein|nr:hypothetical protein [Gemmatimonadota bacterium]
MTDPEERLSGLDWVGAPGLLSRLVIGLLASVRVPPDLVLPTLDLTIELGRRGSVLMSGFQTPLEKAVLGLLMSRDFPLIIALPRTLHGFRIPSEWDEALRDDRMLIISATSRQRSTRETAMERNRLLTRIADTLLVVYASPGGRVWKEACNALAAGKPVRCMDHPANLNLEVPGATLISADGGLSGPGPAGAPVRKLWPPGSELSLLSTGR